MDFISDGFSTGRQDPDVRQEIEQRRFPDEDQVQFERLDYI